MQVVDQLGELAEEEIFFLLLLPDLLQEGILLFRGSEFAFHTALGKESLQFFQSLLFVNVLIHKALLKKIHDRFVSYMI